MNDLPTYYRIARLAKVQSYPLGDRRVIPIYERIEEPLLTRVEAANDPEVRRLILDDYEYDRSWEPTNE